MILSAGPFRYEVDPEWGEPPDEGPFAECAAVAVDVGQGLEAVDDRANG